MAAQHLHTRAPNQRNRPAAHVRALRSRVRPTRALARPSPPALSLAWPSSTAAQPIWVRASLAVGSASDGRPSSSREQNPPARGPTAAPSTTAAVRGPSLRRSLLCGAAREQGEKRKTWLGAARPQHGHGVSARTERRGSRSAAGGVAGQARGKRGRQRNELGFRVGAAGCRVLIPRG